MYDQHLNPCYRGHFERQFILSEVYSHLKLAGSPLAHSLLVLLGQMSGEDKAAERLHRVLRAPATNGDLTRLLIR